MSKRKSSYYYQGSVSAPSDLNAERRFMLGPRMSFEAAEAYKLLRTNVMFSFSDDAEDGEKLGRIVGVTSSFHGEGKSVTSINMAYTMAETGQRVLLVEGDMRKPTLAKRLDFNPSPGLSNLLIGLQNVNEAIQKLAVPVDGKQTVYLDTIVSGDIPPNPSELLGSKRMQRLLEALRTRYDYIIVDLPPVTAVSDPLIVSRFCDGMAVVVRHNVADRNALAETMRQLQLVDAHVLGFIYNGSDGSGGGYYRRRGYYRKGYYSGYYGK